MFKFNIFVCKNYTLFLLMKAVNQASKSSHYKSKQGGRGLAGQQKNDPNRKKITTPIITVSHTT